jgi:hypothetical protein
MNDVQSLLSSILQKKNSVSLIVSISYRCTINGLLDSQVCLRLFLLRSWPNYFVTPNFHTQTSFAINWNEGQIISVLLENRSLISS